MSAKASSNVESAFQNHIQNAFKTAHSNQDRFTIDQTLTFLERNILATIQEEQEKHNNQLRDAFAKFKHEVISDCFDSGDMAWLREEFLKFEKSVLEV